ncbi:MAG: ABC transporter permease [Gemmataceae bacterium]|nr:ABC transporter permease [Gemmataceae bacterium]
MLAIKAMLADRGKLLTSLLGVSFAVVLVNLQGGLLIGLIKKASLLIDYGQADIWVGHRHTNNVDMGNFIPERWVHRIRGVEGVERAEPYLVAAGQACMRDGRSEIVLVVGCDPASLLGNAWIMAEGDSRDIRRPDAILVDVHAADKLGNCQIGDVLEIDNQRAEVVGMTRGIVGFTNNPYIFTTLERARRSTHGVPAGQCSYFLVKARPGTDIQTLCARIRERVPDLDVYDRDAYSWTCMEFWLTRTGIGISFGLAAFLGLLVGLAVTAQTLYASVNERIKEFATLKAMGADDRCIARFLLAQALGTASLGSLLGVASAILAGRSMDNPIAPVILTWWVAAFSVLLIVLVCLLSAGLPYLRIRRIDPATVLRS